VGLLSTANGQPPSRGAPTFPAAGSRRHLVPATSHTGCNGQPPFDFDFGRQIGDPLGVVTLSTMIQYNTCLWHPLCVCAVIRDDLRESAAHTRRVLRLVLETFSCTQRPISELLIPQSFPHRQRTGVQQRCRDVPYWPRGSTAVHVVSHLYRMCPYGPQTHNRRTRFSVII